MGITKEDDLFEIDNTSSWSPVVGGSFVIGGLILGFGPMIAYFLGWAGMPWFVGVITNIVSLPFGVAIAVFGLWIFSHSNGLKIDRREMVVTAWSRDFGKHSETEYGFDSFSAITVKYFHKSRKGSSSHFTVRLQGEDAESSPALGSLLPMM